MPEFKTSFIPKKPAPAIKEAKRRGGSVSLLNIIVFIVFLLSITVAGGLYLYKAILDRNIEVMSQNIDRVKEAIEPELIESLAEADRRIESSRLLIDNHMVVSPIFSLLERLTLKSVRYMDFDYKILTEGGPTFSLTGEARNYSALALQSDALGSEKVIKEPIFANLSLNEVGNVTFNFSTPVAASFLLHKNNLDSVGPRVQNAEEETALEDEFDDQLGDFDAELEALLEELSF